MPYSPLSVLTRLPYLSPVCPRKITSFVFPSTICSTPKTPLSPPPQSVLTQFSRISLCRSLRCSLLLRKISSRRFLDRLFFLCFPLPSVPRRKLSFSLAVRLSPKIFPLARRAFPSENFPFRSSSDPRRKFFFSSVSGSVRPRIFLPRRPPFSPPRHSNFFRKIKFSLSFRCFPSEFVL